MAARKKTAKKAAKKTAKKATASRKTSKVDKLSQTHGKVETAETKPTTLDQIWGDTGMHKYKTLDEEEYKQHLKEMAKVDLQAHAVTIGLIPVDNTEQLKKRLLTEFKKYAATYKLPNLSKGNDKLKLTKEIQQILNEGK